METQTIKDIVFKDVMSGSWEAVYLNYKENKQNIQTASITSSKETVLHIAISDNKTNVIKKLLGMVAEDGKKIKDMKNDRENNPLHLAASLGQVELCKIMVEKDPDLIKARNVNGETPLFLAALHGRKEAFFVLHNKWAEKGIITTPLAKEGPNPTTRERDISHCKKNDGNSILHVTILGEYFDLAFQIINLYPELRKYKNEKGQSALHILASNPSSFRSGSHFGPLDDIIYQCLLVEQLEVFSLPADSGEKSFQETPTKFPKNYETCCIVFGIIGSGLRSVVLPSAWKSRWKEQDIEKQRSSQTKSDGVGKKGDAKLPFPPNYYTFLHFLEFVMELLLIVCGLGFYKALKMKEKKRKHTQSIQLMRELVSGANLWEHEDTGSKPSEDSLHDLWKERIDITMDMVTLSKTPLNQSIGVGPITMPEEGVKDPLPEGSYNIDTKEKSPFLVAAKMGVTEMMEEILNKFPVAIDDTNNENKNAVLLAVENRQPNVYTLLQNKYPNKESIFQKVDSKGNSALHLAATLGQNRPWLIPGAALQMQWELKWYKFVKDSMPRHFFTHLNNDRRTPKEVLAETHTDLVKFAGKWLTSTSESCSVVAALIATVAFASATTLPGGVKGDKGTPIFESEPAFNLFAISSLVALCFSVTSLTMFLSILTSRYQVWDFHSSLPSKLILGLTSLFVSIAAIMVSFCAGHYLALRDKLKYAVFPIYAVTCLPLTLFAVAQFPLYLDLIRSLTTSVPKRSFEVTSL